ncbi:MAG TPA: DinB family protein [Terriglobales bacterium]|nr:DinB family protein [Terriglobales bacterium]
MREPELIADQLRRSFEGEAWHGPAVLEVLSGVTAAQAITRPLENAHSIWEVVLHIRAWEDAVLRRIRGEVVELEGPEDWPAVIDSGDEAWDDTVRSLKLSNAKLYNGILGMKNERLEETVPGEPYDFYYMLHGVVQHNLYHAGQIAVLKKGTSGS